MALRTLCKVSSLTLTAALSPGANPCSCDLDDFLVFFILSSGSALVFFLYYQVDLYLVFLY